MALPSQSSRARGREFSNCPREGIEPTLTSSVKAGYRVLLVIKQRRQAGP